MYLKKQVAEKFGNLGFSGHGENAYDGLYNHGLIARHEINGGVNLLRAIWVPRPGEFQGQAFYGFITFNEIIQRSFIVRTTNALESPIIIVDEYAFFVEFLHTTRTRWEAAKDVDSYIKRLTDLYVFLGPLLVVEKYTELLTEDLLKLDIPDMYLAEYRHYNTIK